MKFRATVTFTYEVPDEIAKGAYGTTNPEKCAKVDEDNLKDELTSLFEILEDSDDLDVLVDFIE